MSQSRKTRHAFGDISTDSFSIEKQNVSQTTSNTTGVSVTKTCGVITTMPLTTPTAGSFSFTVSNDDAQTSSTVFANVISYASTSGSPLVNVNNVTSGAFNLTVRNVDLTNPLSGSLGISYLLLN